MAQPKGSGRSRDHSQRGLKAVALSVAAAAVVTVGASRSLRINFTRSLPRGIYRVVDGPPSRGAIVIACIPSWAGRLARDRRYLWAGDCPGGVAPVGKTVAGVAGDTIITTPEGVTINGRQLVNTRVLARDSEGRPLRPFPLGRYVLSTRELWLSSSHDVRSFDSRYYGPVDLGLVRTRIEPLLTIPSGRGAPP